MRVFATVKNKAGIRRNIESVYIIIYRTKQFNISACKKFGMHSITISNWIKTA